MSENKVLMKVLVFKRDVVGKLEIYELKAQKEDLRNLYG
jgi:hypothetical protein